MIKDLIVDEVRRAGEDYFASFNFDLNAICEDLRRRTEEAARNGQKVASFSPRQPDAAFLAPKKVGNDLTSLPRQVRNCLGSG